MDENVFAPCKKLHRSTEEIFVVESDEELKFREENNSNIKRHVDGLTNRGEVKCTVCNEAISISYPHSHPALRVLVCSSCNSKYEKSTFSQDGDGTDQNCRWCSEPIEKYRCAYCTCIFCESCLKFNFGQSFIGIIKTNWKCFICHPKQLWWLRAVCAEVMDNIIERNSKTNITEVASNSKSNTNSSPVIPRLMRNRRAISITCVEKSNTESKLIRDRSQSMHASIQFSGDEASTESSQEETVDKAKTGNTVEDNTWSTDNSQEEPLSEEPHELIAAATSKCVTGSVASASTSTNVMDVRDILKIKQTQVIHEAAIEIKNQMDALLKDLSLAWDNYSNKKITKEHLNTLSNTNKLFSKLSFFCTSATENFKCLYNEINNRKEKLYDKLDLMRTDVVIDDKVNNENTNCDSVVDSAALRTEAMEVSSTRAVKRKFSESDEYCKTLLQDPSLEEQLLPDIKLNNRKKIKKISLSLKKENEDLDKIDKVIEDKTVKSSLTNNPSTSKLTEDSMQENCITDRTEDAPLEDVTDSELMQVYYIIDDPKDSACAKPQLDVDNLESKPQQSSITDSQLLEVYSKLDTGMLNNTTANSDSNKPTVEARTSTKIEVNNNNNCNSKPEHTNKVSDETKISKTKIKVENNIIKQNTVEKKVSNIRQSINTTDKIKKLNSNTVEKTEQIIDKSTNTIHISRPGLTIIKIEKPSNPIVTEKHVNVVKKEEQQPKSEPKTTVITKQLDQNNIITQNKPDVLKPVKIKVENKSTVIEHIKKNKDTDEQQKKTNVRNEDNKSIKSPEPIKQLNNSNNKKELKNDVLTVMKNVNTVVKENTPKTVKSVETIMNDEPITNEQKEKDKITNKPVKNKELIKSNIEKKDTPMDVQVEIKNESLSENLKVKNTITEKAEITTDKSATSLENEDFIDKCNIKKELGVINEEIIIKSEQLENNSEDNLSTFSGDTQILSTNKTSEQCANNSRTIYFLIDGKEQDEKNQVGETLEERIQEDFKDEFDSDRTEILEDDPKVTDDKDCTGVKDVFDCSTQLLNKEVEIPDIPLTDAAIKEEVNEVTPTQIEETKIEDSPSNSEDTIKYTPNEEDIKVEENESDSEDSYSDSDREEAYDNLKYNSSSMCDTDGVTSSSESDNGECSNTESYFSKDNSKPGRIQNIVSNTYTVNNVTILPCRPSDSEDSDDSKSSNESNQNEPTDTQKCFVNLRKSKDFVLKWVKDQNTDDMDSEEREINRLTNLGLLKRTSRSRTSSMDSDDRPARKKSKNKQTNSLVDSDGDVHEVNSLSDFSGNEMEDSNQNDDNSPSKQFLEQVSDEDKWYSLSDEDVSNGNDEKKEKAKKVLANDFDSDTEIVNSCSDEDTSKKRSTWRNDPLLNQKINLSDSDATHDSYAEDLMKNRKKKTKRRISSTGESSGVTKSNTDSSSNSSGEDSDVQFVSVTKDDPNSPIKTTRRKIRAVISDDVLQESTKKALKEEEKRKERLTQKQLTLDSVLSQTSISQEEMGLILDIDDNKKPLVTVHAKLVDQLKPHQLEGIKFMWQICFESVKRTKEEKGAGCIIAHCMGLGKTRQVVVLSHTLLRHPELKVRHILVVCPLSTVLNWTEEYKMTLSCLKDHRVNLYDIRANCQLQKKIDGIKRWRRSGGVMIMGYDTFQSLVHGKRKTEAQKEFLKEALISPGPDVVVCDEGHMLKNGKSLRFKALMNINTRRRIILTGTPLQNNLKEYYFMVSFVKPDLLGTELEYNNTFINPISNGQYEDSFPEDIALMRRRAHVLHKKLETTVQRFESTELEKYMPPKLDYVLYVQLSTLQIKLYQHYLEQLELLSLESNKKKLLFQNYHNLQYIWTHPGLLQTKLDKKNTTTKSKTYDEDFVAELDPDSIEPHQSFMDTAWFKSLSPEDLLTNVKHGPKIEILLSIVQECSAVGDKLLVFSSSIFELNLIEYFLKESASSEIRWDKNLDYYRMDGTVEPETRQRHCTSFNDPKNKRARVFLISHKVGGLGLNLFAANRVVLMDVNWNPTYDSQSIYRSYRFGQKKTVIVYRLVSMGTMEEVVYSRGIVKLAVSSRVVDEQQISRHFKSDDLQRMYRLEIDYEAERPTPELPKDRLLANLLNKFNPVLYKYCEHQSLLENLPHEKLNAEDMIAAWDEFLRADREAKNPKPNPMPMLADPGPYANFNDLFQNYNFPKPSPQMSLPYMTAMNSYNGAHLATNGFPNDMRQYQHQPLNLSRPEQINNNYGQRMMNLNLNYQNDVFRKPNIVKTKQLKNKQTLSGGVQYSIGREHANSDQGAHGNMPFPRYNPNNCLNNPMATGQLPSSSNQYNYGNYNSAKTALSADRLPMISAKTYNVPTSNSNSMLPYPARQTPSTPYANAPYYPYPSGANYPTTDTQLQALQNTISKVGTPNLQKAATSVSRYLNSNTMDTMPSSNIPTSSATVTPIAQRSARVPYFQNENVSLIPLPNEASNAAGKHAQAYNTNSVSSASVSISPLNNAQPSTSNVTAPVRQTASAYRNHQLASSNQQSLVQALRLFEQNDGLNSTTNPISYPKPSSSTNQTKTFTDGVANAASNTTNNNSNSTTINNLMDTQTLAIVEYTTNEKTTSSSNRENILQNKQISTPAKNNKVPVASASSSAFKVSTHQKENVNTLSSTTTTNENPSPSVTAYAQNKPELSKDTPQRNGHSKSDDVNKTSSAKFGKPPAENQTYRKPYARKSTTPVHNTAFPRGTLPEHFKKT